MDVTYLPEGSTSLRLGMVVGQDSPTNDALRAKGLPQHGDRALGSELTLSRDVVAWDWNVPPNWAPSRTRLAIAGEAGIGFITAEYGKPELQNLKSETRGVGRLGVSAGLEHAQSSGTLSSRLRGDAIAGVDLAAQGATFVGGRLSATLLTSGQLTDFGAGVFVQGDIGLSGQLKDNKRLVIGLGATF